MISDELWDRISTILPYEKPNNTIGRPIIPYRKCSMVFYMFLEPDASGKCCQMSMVQAQHAIGGFNNGLKWAYSKICGSDC